MKLRGDIDSSNYSGDSEKMNKLLKREIHRLRRYFYRKNIKSILVGVSGGPDSVMAFNLIRLAGDTIPGFRLAIAHANFLLRGEESLRDENFVRDYISQFPTIDNYFISFDTSGHSRSKGISIEMAARELRHEWFQSIFKKDHFDRIATGHNANDNEETLLLNLMRGSGTKGLRGMDFDNGRIIRPLLHLSRQAILKMLSVISISRITTTPYVTDSSNLTDDYRRNFLRNTILPLLEQRWSGTHRALQTTLRLMSEENKIVEHFVETALKDSENLLSWETLLSFPSPLTLIYRWILPFGGSPAIAAEMASTLPESPQDKPRLGGRWKIGSDIEITSAGAGLRKCNFNPSFPDHSNGGTAGIGSDNFNPLESEINIFEIAQENQAPLSEVLIDACNDIAYFPGRPENYIWRNPKPGDKMRIGPSIRKSVTGILKEAHITSAARAGVWMLCRKKDDAPVWIPGLRRSCEDLVTEDGSSFFRIKILSPIH